MNIRDYYIEREKKSDFYRPNLHFTAQSGWLNDPNGLIYYKGQYHIFYQHLPNNPYWKNVHMHWGHAVSDDMLHWHDLPIALTPSEPYDYDPNGGGCWSGSSIEYDGKLYVFYTGCTFDEDGTHQTQNIAVSEDGVHFTKYAGNPVIANPPAFGRQDFRDPCVFRHDGMFYMIVGGAVGETAESAGACVYLYKSEDLYHWKFVNTILGPTREFGAMIECPDFFQLGDKWVLSICLMHNKDYKSNLFVIGNMDFSSGRFEVIRCQEQDSGGYWFAPQTFTDAQGRCIQMCWQNTTLWMPWFDDWGPTDNEGWRSCLSLPHVLSLDENNIVHSCPISIDSELTDDKSLEKLDLSKTPYSLMAADPFCWQLCFSLKKSDCFSGRIEIGLLDNGTKRSRITLDLARRIAVLDINDSRDNFGSGQFFSDIPSGEDLSICIQQDKSSLEICFNDETHFVACVYPEPEQNGLWIRTPYTHAVIRNLRLSSFKGR